MTQIVFDRDSVVWHPTDFRMNEMFLVQQTEYLIYRFRHYGYIYLNDIYEALGVAWDPSNENIYYQTDDHSLKFDLIPTEDKTAILVVIN